MEAEAKHFFGFTSVIDFTDSLFRFRDWSLTSIGGILATVTTFVTGFVWDSSQAVYALWVLMGVDWFTGVWKSVRKKELVSHKLFRMPLFFVATSFVLSMSWWMAKTSLMFIPLPAIVYGFFMSVYFVSLVENLGELGLLPKAMVSILRTRFGLKALIRRWKEEEKTLE